VLFLQCSIDKRHGKLRASAQDGRAGQLRVASVQLMSSTRDGLATGEDLHYRTAALQY
jgi:hypothetical protein